MTRVLASVAALLASLALVAAPAAADTGSVADPTGDSAVGPDGPGLDITGASFVNGHHRLVVTVSFAALHRGDLVVSVAPRGGDGVRLVSFYRPGRPARSFVATGSFEDSERTGRVACRGFDVQWDTAAVTARMVLPSRCLSHGYDELRFAVLTETRGGDTDDAPANPSGHTRWIARG